MERFVGPPLVEEGEVARETCPHIRDGVVGVEVNLLVLDGAPEPFDEDVVPPAALASMLI